MRWTQGYRYKLVHNITLDGYIWQHRFTSFYGGRIVNWNRLYVDFTVGFQKSLMAIRIDGRLDLTGYNPVINFADWTEKYSKKYDRSFWKNTVTGEKVWHPPSTKIDDDRKPKEALHNINSSSDHDKLSHDSTNKIEVRTIQRSFDIFHKDDFSLKKNDSVHEKHKSSSNLREDRDVQLDHETFNYPGWEQFRSKKHNKFFWRNRMTHETTWKQPVPNALVDYAPILGQRYLNNREISHLSPDSSSVPRSETQSLNRSNISHKTRPTTSPKSSNPSVKKYADSKVGLTSICLSENSKSSNEKNIEMSVGDKSPDIQNRIHDNTDAVHASTYDNQSNISNLQRDDLEHAGNIDKINSERWVSKYSRKNGKKYWKDRITGETTWRLPTVYAATVTREAAIAALNISRSQEDEISDCVSINRVCYDDTEKLTRAEAQLQTQPDIVHKQKVSEPLNQSQLSALVSVPQSVLSVDVLPQFVEPVLQVFSGSLPAPTLVQIRSTNIDLESKGTKSVQVGTDNNAMVVDLPNPNLTDSKRTAVTISSQSCLSSLAYVNSTLNFVADSTSPSRNEIEGLPITNELDTNTNKKNSESVRQATNDNTNEDGIPLKMDSMQLLRNRKLFDLPGNLPWEISTDSSSATNPLWRILIENRPKI